ncbi:MAG: hypothetical protein ACWGN7_08005 [Thermodesulfovibrionales bacterium]
MSLHWGGIRPQVSERIGPFFAEILAKVMGIHSIHIVGSAVTDDYVDGVSDVNSVVMLENFDLSILDIMAPMGRRFGKRRVAAPLLMTPRYVEASLDTFPIEFLNFGLFHATVYGVDILAPITVDREYLRLQCEREIKSKLIWLRQSRLSSMGDHKKLLDYLGASISGYVPLFRGIIHLSGGDPRLGAAGIMTAMGEIFHLRTDVFQRIFDIRHKTHRPARNEILPIFEEYYRVTEELGSLIDGLKI